jgi:hypothetical protein
MTKIKDAQFPAAPVCCVGLLMGYGGMPSMGGTVTVW